MSIWNKFVAFFKRLIWGQNATAEEQQTPITGGNGMTQGRKRALLVGINYPGTPHALNGCVNDVQTMSDILVKHYGFTDPKERRMLTDNSATTQAILDRLEWLVDGAQPGDVLYFHYSGHGSQMVNQYYNADYEPDGLDEILCPIDLDWRDKVIRDDQLKSIFDRVPAGVNLTVVLDCCHSGSGLDQSYQYQPIVKARTVDVNSPNKARVLPMPADIANRGYGLNLQLKPRSVQSRNIDRTGLLISGCQSDQTSADAWIHNKYMGAATYYLAYALEQNNWDINYKQLVEIMNNKLAQYGYTQRPELNGSVQLFTGNFLTPII